MKKSFLNALEWDVYRYIIIVAYLCLTGSNIREALVSGFWLQALLFGFSILWIYLRFHRKTKSATAYPEIP